MNTKTLVGGALVLALTATTVLAADRGGQRFDFSTFDADGNGEITQAEVTAAAASRFANADSDGNGLLSKEEILAQMQARTNGNASDRFERRIDRMISHLDANDDGSISLEEQQASDRTSRMFERLDADDSGTISQAEADAAKERGGKRGGKNKRGGDRGNGRS